MLSQARQAKSILRHLSTWADGNENTILRKYGQKRHHVIYKLKQILIEQGCLF